MSCNCEGKTINIGMGCCQPVLAPADQYYTKYQVDKLIESATTSGCCITPEEVDEKIDEAISGITVSGVTQEELDEAIASAKTDIEAEIPSLEGYATEQWVSSFTYDQATIDEKVAEGGTFDPTMYYNKTQTNNLVESAVTRVEAEIPTVPTSNTAFTNDAGYITGVDLSNYATKAEIPVVPTSNTAFTNDAGYLTEHQSLSAYSTISEVNTLINQSVSGKVDTNTYTAYTASTQTTINSKADSSTLNNYLLKSKIWCGTESEYNSIVNKDSETLYLIHE